jgi:hypothetical protein
MTHKSPTSDRHGERLCIQSFITEEVKRLELSLEERSIIMRRRILKDFKFSELCTYSYIASSVRDSAPTHPINEKRDIAKLA